MTWKKHSVATVALTKKLAARISAMPAIKGDRPLSGSRLRFLQTQLEAQKLIAFRWVTVALPDGREFRINGQHSSHLFAGGAPIPPGATVILERYTADTESDAADLWARFDPPASSRSKNDVLRAHLRSSEVYQSLSVRAASTIVSAVAAEVHGPNAFNRIAHADKILLLDPIPQFVYWAADLATQQKWLNRIGVVWAMYRSWNLEVSAAREFWGWVADGGDPDPRRPTRELQRLLLSSHANTGQGARKLGQRFDPLTFCNLCADCWNAWRRGAETWKPRVPRRGWGGKLEMV